MPPRPHVDGRWLAAAIFFAYCLALKVTALIVGQPVFEMPPFSWIGPMAPYFADLRGVVSWSDQYCTERITDISTLRDPWGRPVNYHVWWLYLHDLGINSGNVMTFGYFIAIAFLIAAFFTFGRLTVFGALAAGLCLISYAAMFGLERANVDLLVFAVLALALAAYRFPPAAALIIGFAAILKFHPLFAFGALLLPPWKKSLTWLGVGVLFFAAGMMDHLGNFLGVLGSAPNMHTGILSFGMATLGLEITEYYGCVPKFYHFVVASGMAAVIFAFGVAAWVRPLITELTPDHDRELFAFRMGAGIYLGCFLLGTNHDYRLVFLIFCLPLLLMMIERNIAHTWAFAALGLILVLVNWLYLLEDANPLDYVLKQGTAWALFVCLTALYVATLPPALQWPRRKLTFKNPSS